MKNNTIVLESCIRQFKEENEFVGNDSSVFEIFSLSQICKRDDYSVDVLDSSIIDGANDGGLDSIVLFVDNEYLYDMDSVESLKYTKNTEFRIQLSQVKYESSFKESALDKLIASIPVLFNLETSEQSLAKRFNIELVERIMLMRKAWLSTVNSGGRVKVEVFYFTKANEVEVNSVFLEKVEQIKSLFETLFYRVMFSFDCFSAKELLALHSSTSTGRLSLRYREVPIATSFNKGYGYVGIVGLDDYYDFITDASGKIIEDIFESNIRHYQGDVDVNTKIESSLSNEFEIDFWWLNNGITIIAENPNQISKTLTLENVKIVNGLQTTFTLEKYFNQNTTLREDSRSILVKVIIINEGDANKKAIDRIISSTNSQNAVPPVLLRATDDIQRKLEVYFSNSGYYYDRRKNYYKNLSKPASRIFGIQATAQAIQSILHKEPDTARAKPTTLIKTNESYKKIFDESVNFSAYLKCVLIYKVVNDFIKAELVDEKKSLGKAYALHLARVLATIVTTKGDYTVDDILKIEVEKISESMLKHSFAALEEMIVQFKETSKTTSDSSVSKSGIFRDFLNKNAANFIVTDKSGPQLEMTLD